MLSHRLATPDDIPAIAAVMDRAITELQRDHLSPAAIVASRAAMGLDTQLIDDGSYFVVHAADGQLAGCGGWSFRATLYGGNHSGDLRDARLATIAAGDRWSRCNSVIARSITAAIAGISSGVASRWESMAAASPGGVSAANRQKRQSTC